MYRLLGWCACQQLIDMVVYWIDKVLTIQDGDNTQLVLGKLHHLYINEFTDFGIQVPDLVTEWTECDLTITIRNHNRPLLVRYILT